jgi:Domain related to MnhB subunit of Na+/H+ antiporter
VYGSLLVGIGVTERHATDLVTALNFDFRAFDTLGEEFILFASVLGVVLILRQLRREHERPNQDEPDEHQLAGASEALRALALVLVPGLLAVGVYIIVHGQITPGGGFQGGVIFREHTRRSRSPDSHYSAAPSADTSPDVWSTGRHRSVTPVLRVSRQEVQQLTPGGSRSDLRDCADRSSPPPAGASAPFHAREPTRPRVGRPAASAGS